VHGTLLGKPLERLKVSDDDDDAISKLNIMRV
jgi:hypothetical protein